MYFVGQRDSSSGEMLNVVGNPVLCFTVLLVDIPQTMGFFPALSFVLVGGKRTMFEIEKFPRISRGLW